MDKKDKAALLLAPLMLLATAQSFSEIVSAEYDHGTQRVEGGEEFNTSYATSTFNGTQTFDFQGNPSDSDADSDENGY